VDLELRVNAWHCSVSKISVSIYSTVVDALNSFFVRRYIILCSPQTKKGVPLEPFKASREHPKYTLSIPKKRPTADTAFILRPLFGYADCSIVGPLCFTATGHARKEKPIRPIAI